MVSCEYIIHIVMVYAVNLLFFLQEEEEEEEEELQPSHLLPTTVHHRNGYCSIFNFDNEEFFCCYNLRD